MLKNTLLLILFTLSSSLYAQKIDKSKNELKSAKEDTRPPLPTEPVNQNAPSALADDDDDDSPGIGAFFGRIIFFAAFYTTIGDYKNEDQLYNKLSPYPYFDKKTGNFIKLNEDSIAKSRVRFDVENHILYSNNASFGNHFKGKFRLFQYVFVQADYRELMERDKFTKTNSSLSLFQFNLGSDRLRYEKFNLGWTLGATYIANDINEAGFSYGLNTDIFAFKNVSFHSAMIWSKINGLPVNSFEFRGKYHRKNHFFSMGYENLRIASPSYNYATFGAGFYF
ncbi:hypothetical protein [Flavobacterium terrigena]|uniref:Outer membrane protein beta-barrel domain-containing protein n=1 Tax=Flavobacterium terrigena TaxID=402734 RepID=A0A1H6V913_9FLAO|nr:hypothetical protein [Flavobacterium terrigena]SEJ01093.1 hypothetical protein SAMN05660918_2143 [Flavobacterium terrigena]